MSIKGYLKSSFIDYPDHISSVIFLGGCNFRCPYCHNGDLVFSELMDDIDYEEVEKHLKKRIGIIEHVVVTGGEPTEDKNLLGLLRKLKSLNVSVKLDTNGSHPEIIQQVIDLQLVDFIAMDIKNAMSKYPQTIGLNIFNRDVVKTSIDIIESSGLDFEFRTTLVKELHTIDDVIEIAHWLRNDSKYVLQQYSKSDKELTENMFSFIDLDEIQGFKALLEQDHNMTKIEVKGRF